MRQISVGMVALAIASGLATAQAADLGDGASGGGGLCLVMPRSPILDLASAGDMEREVDKRYSQALEVSRAETTVASRSPRFVWSNEAKAACGKAIGYFAGREINEEMVSKCDCYHGRMVSFMR
jgi:hypothetical protein